MSNFTNLTFHCGQLGDTYLAGSNIVHHKFANFPATKLSKLLVMDGHEHRNQGLTWILTHATEDGGGLRFGLLWQNIVNISIGMIMASTICGDQIGLPAMLVSLKSSQQFWDFVISKQDALTSCISEPKKMKLKLSNVTDNVLGSSFLLPGRSYCPCSFIWVDQYEFLILIFISILSDHNSWAKVLKLGYNKNWNRANI